MLRLRTNGEGTTSRTATVNAVKLAVSAGCETEMAEMMISMLPPLLRAVEALEFLGHLR